MNYVSYILFLMKHSQCKFFGDKNEVGINTDRPVYQKAKQT